MAISIPTKEIIDITQDASLNNAARNLRSGQLSRRTNSNIETFNIKKFGRPKFHWTKDKPDSRDYLYKIQSTTNPTVVDLRNFCSAIEDQGALGSCTGQAIAGAIELINKRNKIIYDSSRLFIYYYERFLINTVNYDSGAYIRDGIKVVAKYGAALETLWPYIISKFTVRPSNIAISDALKRRVTLYERAVDFDACINALSNNFPVIIGFYVYSSFMSKQTATTGIMTYPNTAREVFLGGHAVLLVGFNHNTQRFIARNSWGTKWGDKGYFYMPYRVIQNAAMSSDFWVIKSITNPITISK